MNAIASMGTSFLSAEKTRWYRSPRPPTAKMFEISRITSRSRFSRATRFSFCSIVERLRTTREASTTG